jgi:aspartate aminotransferase
MSILSDRIKQLGESETLAMAKRARALQAEGHNMISLSTGEPDFFTPDHIKEAAKNAIQNNKSYYTPVAGIPELRQAISHKLKRDNNLTYSPEQIVVSTGAKHTIMNLILSVINPGDEVIIPTPYWVSYAEMVRFAGGIPIFVKGTFENEYKITGDELESNISTQTKLLLFSSPCNPTGAIYSKEELIELSEVLLKYPKILICSDEIYEHINFIGTHYSIAQIDTMYERTIVVNGVSKGFAMTGWRIGYLAGPKEIAMACEKLQGQFTSGANSIAQYAAVAAMDNNLEPTYAMRDKFKERRDLVIDLSKDIQGFKTFIPKGAFYLYPDISYYFGKSNGETTIQNAFDLSMYLLNDAHVATVSGSAFGSEECIRLSFATSSELLKEAFRRMKVSLDKLI